MLQLRDFQQQASDLIAERFRRYSQDPSTRGPESRRRRVPFFQALAAITASGKTVMLADAVAGIAAGLPIAPVVLWLSMGKVVVEQSFANLSPGGRYHHLLGDTTIELLAAHDPETVREAQAPILYFATVGTFNQKDKERGGRLIYKSDIDDQTTSTWDGLKLRTDSTGVRRPLLIVYDEGHNLTDQQTDLILELTPDAILVASATMKLPARLAKEIEHLREDGWADDELVTEVPPKAVAESGLIKSNLLLAGYEAPMEETVGELLRDLATVRKEASAHGIEGSPKAVYVCKTNIVEGDAFRRDDPRQPFDLREAPPIVIWRYLVDHGGVDPDDIAVYCSLKFHKDYPPPTGFHLFAGGDKDYAAFTGGRFTHIIFNLSLQEGWDDPLAYFAYVDKSMESNVAVEQLIGRLLRQPGTQHYACDALNTAHFYVRVDKRGAFRQIIDDVTATLDHDAPEVRLITATPDRPKPIPLAPREVRTIHRTQLDPSLAKQPVAELLAHMNDYRADDGTNTRAAGGRLLVQRHIGDGHQAEFVWEEFEHSNAVSARWLFQREVLRRYPGALGVAATNDGKLDALIGFNSNAYAHIVRTAEDVVEAYVKNVVLVQPKPNPYQVGPIVIRPDELERFDHSVHEGYSDLKPEELAFARALDECGNAWCRNPSQSGYGIPLITPGRTRTFYPDFFAWPDDDSGDTYAIDTTGAHLLAEKTARKLLSIRPPRGVPGQLHVRFVTKGKLDAALQQSDKAGYTVFSQRADHTLRATYVEEMSEAVQVALQPY